MKRSAVLIFCVAIFLGGASFSWAHEEHKDSHGHHHPILPDLPVIPLTIENKTDVFISLTISSTLCSPRVLLKPGQSITVENCFRRGLYHQVKAVFYTKDKIVETHEGLFLIKPGENLIFYKLPN